MKPSIASDAPAKIKIRNAGRNRCEMIIMTASGVISIRANVTKLGRLLRMLPIFIRY